ncbi:MAG: hypothetical protein LBC69_02945 [Eubacteriaceae bacterium]|jgi:hypothetical protein|nr:hypothetical protein [Eubacteriaceae bacterium]
MIHVIRENEGIMDIATHYGVDASVILEANRATQFVHNRAIWIPSDASTSIPKGKNRGAWDPLAPALELFAINATDEAAIEYLDTPPLPLRGVFVEAYRPRGASLGAKDDAFPIAASLFHGAEPAVALANLQWYTDPRNLEKFFSSLRYKDYQGALLCVETEDDENAYKKMRDCLYGFGFNVSVRAGERALERMGDSPRVERYFLKADKSLIGVAPFEIAMERLAACFPKEKLGASAALLAADVNKATQKATYPDISHVDEIIARTGIRSLYYDESSQLCFLQYRERGELHNVVFEDLRALEAKTAILKRVGAKSMLVENPARILGIITGIAFI